MCISIPIHFSGGHAFHKGAHYIARSLSFENVSSHPFHAICQDIPPSC